ncbi:hypothetical protein SPRA44_160037 [Serratia proteamaculans]|nr:hypothetical protein SPRA44_160037 [Serratia proteamaculans]
MTGLSSHTLQISSCSLKAIRYKTIPYHFSRKLLMSLGKVRDPQDVSHIMAGIF